MNYFPAAYYREAPTMAARNPSQANSKTTVPASNHFCRSDGLRETVVFTLVHRFVKGQ